MAIFAKDSIKSIQEREIVLLETERQIIEGIESAAREISGRKSSITRDIDRLAELNKKTAKPLSENVSDIVSLLQIIKDKLGSHFKVGELEKSITEWNTILKILRDEKEYGKINQAATFPKFKTQLNQDITAMMKDIEKLVKVLVIRKDKIDNIMQSI